MSDNKRKGFSSLTKKPDSELSNENIVDMYMDKVTSVSTPLKEAEQKGINGIDNAASLFIFFAVFLAAFAVEMANNIIFDSFFNFGR